MIQPQDAFEILADTRFHTSECQLPLAGALNHVLAETVYAPIDMPPFPQATMDGYALCLHDETTYRIIGEVKAGDSSDPYLQPGEAVKIFTGAAVPAAAQAVIQIEKSAVHGTSLILEVNPKKGTNIRQRGAQITEGSVALQKGLLLNPAAIGFLAGLGFTGVKVFKKPRTGIVVCGNELVAAGQKLEKGQVYESNAMMLEMALAKEGFFQVSSYKSDDDFDNTFAVLSRAAEENDVLIISGGISVGDYDFVGSALQKMEVETLFYTVDQKPGKPLFAGNFKGKPVFALPGNPAASLTCFYVYVLPTMRRLSRLVYHYETTAEAVLASDYEVNNTRNQFLKAHVADGAASILPHQDSAMLDSFAASNALVYVSSGHYHLNQGDKVSVYFI